MILLVEDDENLGFLVKDSLEMAGLATTLYADGDSALEAFILGDFQLCIFDVMLPGKDGFSLASEVRLRSSEIPFLFLTARNQKEDRIKGFQLGADDYISKPFSIEELVLRVKAILNRTRAIRSPQSEHRYTLGSFVLDSANFLLIGEDNTQQLTRRESQILTLLCQHKNQVLDRDLIQKLVWEDEGYVVGRSLDVFVSKLRKYLKSDPGVQIVNLHGIGYKLTVTP